jgi:hypothetical protein
MFRTRICISLFVIVGVEKRRHSVAEQKCAESIKSLIVLHGSVPTYAAKKQRTGPAGAGGLLSISALVSIALTRISLLIFRNAE